MSSAQLHIPNSNQNQKHWYQNLLRGVQINRVNKLWIGRVIGRERERGTVQFVKVESDKERLNPTTTTTHISFIIIYIGVYESIFCWGWIIFENVGPHLWRRVFSLLYPNYSSKLWERERERVKGIWCDVFFCSYPLFAFANLFSYFFPQNTKQKFPLDMTYSSYTLPLLFPSLFPSTRGWHNESNTRFCLHAYKSFSINAISGLELRLTKRFGFKLPFSQHH